MALTATVQTAGGVEVAGAYLRIVDLRLVELVADDGSKSWRIGYGVRAYKDAEARKAGSEEIAARGLDVPKVPYDIDAGGNPYAAVYADLKGRLPGAEDA